MPVPPYSWQVNDFPSASRLQQELRQNQGVYFQPNGVRFHATRPVYKVYSKTTPGFTSATWVNLVNANAGPLNWPVLADTGGLDPIDTAALNGAYLLNGGGAVGSNGGLGLIISSFPFANGATSIAASGIGSNGSHISTGTVTPFPSANQPIATIAVDLYDWGTSPLSGMYYSAGAGPATATSTDGSGVAARTQGFWASVYPANGTALSGSSLPSITTSLVNGNQVTPAILNNSIQQTMQLFNMPPALRVVAAAGSSLAAGLDTEVSYFNVTPTTDTYGAFNNTNSIYTCPLPGLYLVYVCGGVDSATGNIASKISINGNHYGGPQAQAKASTQVAAAAVRVFNLNAGDTISHFMLSPTTQTTSTSNPSIFIVLWLGAAGAPQVSSLPVPDVTYNFAAGTPGNQVASVLTNHVFQDLSRLLHRPYTMAYQSPVQTGLTQSAYSTVTLQNVGCPVHATSDNSYGSWSGSNTWTAPTNGWYLAVGEVLQGTPSLTTACYSATGFTINPPGLTAQDQYEAKGMSITGQGGASAIGIYYLAAGDTIQLTTYVTAASATTSSLYVSGQTSNSHMEVVWLSE